MSSQSPLITIPLDDLLETILPHGGIYYKVITKDLALVLESYLKERLDYKVRFTDWDGSPLKHPELWYYKEWYEDYERYLNLKKRSEEERIARWILNANIENLTKALIKGQLLDEKHARSTAINLLQKGAGIEVLNFFGVKKLVTKEEEL